MDDYGSNAALGFIQGSIIGQGISEVTTAYRNGIAMRREVREIEQDYFNLRAQYINLRNHAIDLDVIIKQKDAEIAVGEARIAQGKHEIALRDHEIALRNEEIARRDHEIAKRDHALALMRQQLHQTEDILEQSRSAHSVTKKIRDNLTYAFDHYRRLLKIRENGGDAYDEAWAAWWSPDHVPPNQRSEPKK